VSPIPVSLSRSALGGNSTAGGIGDAIGREILEHRDDAPVPVEESDVDRVLHADRVDRPARRYPESAVSRNPASIEKPQRLDAVRVQRHEMLCDQCSARFIEDRHGNSP
jgi:hypothetical protein